MSSLTSILSLAHLLGLVLSAGAATVKLVLLLRCGRDTARTAAYLDVARPITRLIIIGLILLTLSGIGWLVAGYPFSMLLGVKLSMVVAIWVLGPVIDNAVEPRFRKLAPAAGESVSAAFAQARNLYVSLEIVATLLFYLIIAMWLQR